MLLVVAIDCDGWAEDMYVSVFKEIVSELHSWDQSDIDSLMHDSKREIVCWYRGSIKNAHTHIIKERFFSTALYLMISLIKFAPMPSSAKGRPPIGQVTLDRFLSALTAKYSGNVKFFEEICLFLMHTFGAILNTPNGFNNTEFNRYYKNPKQGKNRFDKNGNQGYALGRNACRILEASVQISFFVTMCDRTTLFDKFTTLSDQKFIPDSTYFQPMLEMKELPDWFKNTGQVASCFLRSFYESSKDNITIAATKMGLDFLFYAWNALCVHDKSKKGKDTWIDMNFFPVAYHLDPNRKTEENGDEYYLYDEWECNEKRYQDQREVTVENRTSEQIVESAIGTLYVAVTKLMNVLEERYEAKENGVSVKSKLDEIRDSLLHLEPLDPNHKTIVKWSDPEQEKLPNVLTSFQKYATSETSSVKDQSVIDLVGGSNSHSAASSKVLEEDDDDEDDEDFIDKGNDEAVDEDSGEKETAADDEAQSRSVSFGDGHTRSSEAETTNSKSSGKKNFHK